ncbi:hypothetical protein QTP88_010475 [Uroleucon formosanum]
MDNNISAWLDEADDVMLDDFDPNEVDSDVEVLDNPEISDESVENKSDTEIFCFDENDFRGYNKGKDLCKPHLIRRQSIPILSIPLIQQITRFTGVISSPKTGTEYNEDDFVTSEDRDPDIVDGRNFGTQLELENIPFAQVPIVLLPLENREKICINNYELISKSSVFLNENEAYAEEVIKKNLKKNNLELGNQINILEKKIIFEKEQVVKLNRYHQKKILKSDVISHRFPNPRLYIGRLLKWMEIVGLKNMTPENVYIKKTICDVHFDTNIKSTGTKGLNANAYPTLNMSNKLNAIVNDYKRFLRVCNKSRQSRYSAVEHYKPPFLMSSHGIPPSSSKNPNPSSSLKPKPQPPKEYVQMRNERFQENKEILRDGLTPVDRVRSEQQFGTKQKLNEINPKNKP